MADAQLDVSDSSDERLVDVFDEALKLYNDILSKKYTSTDAELEGDIKKCIKRLELATKLVNIAALFSSNETIEDMSTETVKYLLLPAFLGLLTLKLVTGSRREIVELARIYLRDFVQRCKEYSITEVEIPLHNDEKNSTAPSEKDLNAKMAARDEKIKRLAKEKELDKKINNLKTIIDSTNVDESSKREYYLTLIEYHIMKSLEELEFIKAEMPLIEMMEHTKLAKRPDSQKNQTQRKPPPLKPFIITKNDVQKAVFGQGYPSLPVYTVQEFYDQRVKEGSFPDSHNHPSSSQKVKNRNMEENGDDEDENKEKLLEDDDPVALQRARNMDEFKDDHRRGEGNRYNRS